MSRTIGRKRPASSPIGDYTAMCSHCGVVWYRSEMWVDRQGLLVCPDEGKGRDAVTLSELVAQTSARPKRRVIPRDGYPLDHNDDPPDTGNPVPFNPDPRSPP